MYIGILGRNPSKDEVQDRIQILKTNPTLESFINDMVTSQEFKVMRIPNLISEEVNIKSNLKIFFLHVPKTAGTSLRSWLTKYHGIPPYLIYYGFLKDIDKSMDFWPFWVGHANIQKFPNSHSGFTSFRETRSRLISQYRQIQRSLVPGFDLRKNAVQKLLYTQQYYHEKSQNFNIWLKNFGHSICHYYIPNTASHYSNEIPTLENFTHSVGTDREWISRIDNSPKTEIRNSLEKSMKRFTAASWVHDSESQAVAIKKLFGDKDIKINIPTLNEFDKSTNYQSEIISKQSVELMEEISRKDQIVFESAINAGIISENIPFNKDEIFFNSRKRLGYMYENE